MRDDIVNRGFVRQCCHHPDHRGTERIARQAPTYARLVLRDRGVEVPIREVLKRRRAHALVAARIRSVTRTADRVSAGARCCIAVIFEFVLDRRDRQARDVVRDRLLIFGGAKPERHRVHAKAAGIVRVKAAHARIELLKLRFDVPSRETGDSGRKHLGIAAAIHAVTLSAELEELLSPLAVPGVVPGAVPGVVPGVVLGLRRGRQHEARANADEKSPKGQFSDDDAGQRSSLFRLRCFRLQVFERRSVRQSVRQTSFSCESVGPFARAVENLPRE